MTDDLTKRAQAVLAIRPNESDGATTRLIKRAYLVCWEGDFDYTSEMFALIAAYMQRDAEQRAEIERLERGLSHTASVVVPALVRELADTRALSAICSPELTVCPRCQNDIQKCDGLYAGPRKERSTHD